MASLPIVGNLFKSNNVTKAQTELMIVMVPHILRSPDITEEDLRAIATGNEATYKLNYAAQKPAPPKVPQMAPAITPPPTAAPAAVGPVPGATPTPSGITAGPLASSTVPQPAAPPATAPLIPPSSPAPPTAAPAAGPVTFLPLQTDPKAGSTVPISIQVNNVTDLASVQMSLKFDPKMLSVNNLITGDLLRRNGPDLVPSRNVLNDSGEAMVSISRDPASGGVSGSGAVLTVVFQTHAKGPTTISLSQFTMTASNGQSLPLRRRR